MHYQLTKPITVHCLLFITIKLTKIRQNTINLLEIINFLF